PLTEPRAGRDRACGPVGCVLAGWIRVGWGVVAPPAPPDPPPPRGHAARRPTNLALECAPVAPSQPVEPYAALPSMLAPPARTTPRAPLPALDDAPAFRPFAGRAPAPTPGSDAGFAIDASYFLDRGIRARPIGRLYAWGPSGTDWDPLGRWQVLWSWPWQAAAPGDLDTRASAPGPVPWPSMEAAVRALGNGLGLPPEWSVVPGDDPDHALFLERRPTLGGSNGGGTMMMLATLEADRAPVEVRLPGGEPWPELQGAVRVGGRWYLTTSQSSQAPGEPAATVVWTIDGAVAREVTRLPRVAPELAGPARLARRIGGAGANDAVGLLVIGPDAEGAERGSSLWVSTLDPESHGFSDPELLAPADLSDRAIGACTGDDSGWEVEAAFPGTIELRVAGAWRSRLQGGFARMRIGRKSACIDDAFGSGESGDPRSPRGSAPGAAPGVGAGGVTGGGAALLSSGSPRSAPSRAPYGSGVRTIPVTVLAEHVRARLRCRAISP
ncbi:MAG TPA: hypothetical protein VH044_16725, partial [Polyangiaceae bacterium]|nr:hypothetical protein [Polyangiaceae bacterium]